jgi:hypothetical protein
MSLWGMTRGQTRWLLIKCRRSRTRPYISRFALNVAIVPSILFNCSPVFRRLIGFADGCLGWCAMVTLWRLYVAYVGNQFCLLAQSRHRATHYRLTRTPADVPGMFLLRAFSWRALTRMPGPNFCAAIIRTGTARGALQ